MQNMKTARKAYRQEFSRVIDERRVWNDDAPGLRAFVRANRRLWPHPVGKLAQILA